MFLAPIAGAALSAALPAAISAGTLAAGKAIGNGLGQGTLKVVGNAIDAVGEFFGGDGNPQVPSNVAQQQFIANQQMMQQRR